MTDHPDIVKRLTATSIVIGHMPELPGYNGSVLTIDDEEAARCVADIDAGAAEITRLRAEAEALRKALQEVVDADAWLSESTLIDAPTNSADRWDKAMLEARAAIAATKEKQA